MGVYILYQFLVVFIGALGMGLIAGTVIGAFGFKFWTNHNELMAMKTYQVAMNNFKEAQEKMLGALFVNQGTECEEHQNSQYQGSQSVVQNIRDSVIPSTRFDIIFDSDLVSFISTGIFSNNWRGIMKDILDTVEEKSSAFPEGTNTILVRSVHVSDKGGNEYVLEPLANSNLKKLSGG
jgi:hypothetical protein